MPYKEKLKPKDKLKPTVVLSQQILAADGHLTVQPLTRGHEAEVLTFLSVRYLQTFFMAGLIRDNGLESPFNRGTFYACRNAQGQLVGVALIGHATVFEAHSEAAIKAFARLAQGNPRAYMLAGEPEEIERFWSHYANARQVPHRFCRELLLVQREPVELAEAVCDLRLATLDDLDLIMPVQAQMASEESGVNPLEFDPVGFPQRCARRIEEGRAWVLTRQGQLLFKADIISDTPEVIYLEGIYVNPTMRSQGFGRRCLAQLNHYLLTRTKSICLLVNERNKRSHAFYYRVGFELESYYDTIYLKQSD